MTKAKNLVFDAADAACMEYLRDFIPDKVFDAHTHPFCRAFAPEQGNDPSSVFSQLPMDVVSYPELCTLQKDIFGHVQDYRIHGFPLPDPPHGDNSNGLRAAYNGWIAQQVERYRHKMVGSALVIPSDTPEQIEAMVLEYPGMVGLKCYLWFSPDVLMSDMDSFLPESAWQVADKHGLTLMVHLTRPGRLADPDNLRQLLEKTQRYPNARVILAHCGGNFAARCMGAAMECFRDRSNVWFDLAAICEPTPMIEAIQAVGSERVIWGTDCPISLNKGRCVSMGAGYLWISTDNLSDRAEAEASDGVALYIIEQLQAFRLTCRILRLTRQQREQVFYTNAMRLFANGL